MSINHVTLQFCVCLTATFHELNSIVRDLMFLLQDSTPHIVIFFDNPGCPCGGTHVADISIISNLKVIIILDAITTRWIFKIYPKFLKT